MKRRLPSAVRKHALDRFEAHIGDAKREAQKWRERRQSDAAVEALQSLPEEIAGRILGLVADPMARLCVGLASPHLRRALRLGWWKETTVQGEDAGAVLGYLQRAGVTPSAGLTIAASDPRAILDLWEGKFRVTFVPQNPEECVSLGDDWLAFARTGVTVVDAYIEMSIDDVFVVMDMRETITSCFPGAFIRVDVSETTDDENDALFRLEGILEF